VAGGCCSASSSPQPVAAAVEAACADRFLLVNAVAPTWSALAPPLTVSRQEVDLALAAIEEALGEVAGSQPDGAGTRDEEGTAAAGQGDA
jgi:acetylornithine/succinyldiaminopimelate/putrescine aminotransferase